MDPKTTLDEQIQAALHPTPVPQSDEGVDGPEFDSSSAKASFDVYRRSGAPCEFILKSSTDLPVRLASKQAWSEADLENLMKRGARVIVKWTTD